jgi:hypothetical protein
MDRVKFEALIRSAGALVDFIDGSREIRSADPLFTGDAAFFEAQRLRRIRRAAAGRRGADDARFIGPGFAPRYLFLEANLYHSGICVPGLELEKKSKVDELRILELGADRSFHRVPGQG